MKRAVKFKLKNGKEITIRPLKIDDYNAFVKYMNEFRKGPSAKWTWQYPGRPLVPRERAEKDWSDKNSLFIGAFDGDKLIGTANIMKKNAGPPIFGSCCNIRNSNTGKIYIEWFGNKIQTDCW